MRIHELRKFQIEEFIRTKDRADIQRLITHVGDIESHGITLLLAELRNIKLIGLDHQWVGRIRTIHHRRNDADKLIRFPLVRLDTGLLCYITNGDFRIKNNLKPCAVADSKCLFLKRRFGAASAGVDSENLQGVISG